MDPPARRQKRSYYCRHCNALVSNTGGMVPDHGYGAARARYSVAHGMARPRRARASASRPHVSRARTRGGMPAHVFGQVSVRSRGGRTGLTFAR